MHDDVEYYRKKIIEILENNKIKSVTVAVMEVTYCFGLFNLVSDVIEESSQPTPLEKQIVGVKGNLQPKKEEYCCYSAQQYAHTIKFSLRDIVR